MGTCLSNDNICDDGSNHFNQSQIQGLEFFNEIHLLGLPSHELNLKLEIPIMLFKNIDPSAGLCNGTRPVIQQFGNHVIKAKVISRSDLGDMVYIPWVLMIPFDT